MSESMDGVPAGQDPAETTPTPFPAANPGNTTPSGQDPADGGGLDDIDALKAELAKVRREAASYRVERNQLKDQFSDYDQIKARLQDLEDAGKSEAEKLRDKLNRAQAQQQNAAQEAATAKAQLRLVMLAAKAGIDPALVEFLDVSRLDLDDEDATLEVLKKLAPKKRAASGGGPSNPATQKRDDTLSDDELVDQYFRPAGRGINMLFGGNQ